MDDKIKNLQTEIINALKNNTKPDEQTKNPTNTYTPLVHTANTEFPPLG